MQRSFVPNTNYWSHVPRTIRDVIDDAEKTGKIEPCTSVTLKQTHTDCWAMATRQRLRDHLDGKNLERTVREDGSTSYGLAPKYRRLNEHDAAGLLVKQWKLTLDSI